MRVGQPTLTWTVNFVMGTGVILCNGVKRVGLEPSVFCVYLTEIFYPDAKLGAMVA